MRVSGLVFVLLLQIVGCAPAPVDTPRAVVHPYDRSAFSGWVDADGDCQDTRAELLIATSRAPVELSASGCTVTYGLWIDPYGGGSYDTARAIQIDHLVPLKWAWDHGASEWSAAKRARFALDADNLVAVSGRLNAQKGAQDPLSWMPTDRSGQCVYLQNFAKIVEEYALQVTTEWQSAMARKTDRTCAEGRGT